MSLTQHVKGFLRDETGVVLAEALLLLPLLIWGFLALVVYWDVFRTINTSQKAAYSISDLMSRQSTVSAQYLDGLQNVINFLTPGSPQSAMRITSIQFDETNNKYDLLFSRSPGNLITPHTQASIQLLKTKIPTMKDLDSVIIVETAVDYEPGFNTGVLSFAPGVEAETFTQFIVTRPRFWRRVCMTPLPPICVG